MMSTASPSSALTNSRRPLGLNTACSGFLPWTGIENASVLVRVSVTAISFLPSMAATTQRPSGEIDTPSGDSPRATAAPSLRAPRSTSCRRLFGWSLTYSQRPSPPTARPRGLAPPGMSATTSSFAVSITEIVPVPSLGT